MDRTRKVLASVGLLLGAVVVGAATAAAVDGDPDGPGDETTTSLSVSTTTVDTSTTTVSTTSVSNTTALDPTVSTTIAPGSRSTTSTSVPDEPPPEESVVGAEAFGLCTAFSGRPQPGNSQGWQRLQDAADGDVDAYCAAVFAAKDAQRNSEPAAEEPEVEVPENTMGSANTPAPESKAAKPDAGASKPASKAQGSGNRAGNEGTAGNGHGKGKDSR